MSILTFLKAYFKPTLILTIFSTLILSFIVNAKPTEKSNFNTHESTESRQMETTIDVIVGLAKPPYVISESDTGFELEVITTVLNKMDTSPRFIYAPLGRSLKLLDQGMGEALLTINEYIVPNSKIRSNPYITYQNVAISLRSSGINIDKIEDLEKNSVASFQFAHKYLGPIFATATKNNANYIEIPNQFQQVEMLLEKRIEVIVMDINIFNYIFTQLTMGNKAQPELSVHKVFPENPYSMAFKDETKVQTFNTKLKEFLQSPEYQSLKQKYKIF
ncbi:transporter substrate-binding domain-containing protein [Psychrosphaera haliotis]|nr:transporter substrate-binding domain-containing protein [Psychrosphaera haliotis]